MAQITFQEGKPFPQKARIAIVISRFNEDIGQGLLQGAREELLRGGAEDAQLSTYWVPGAMEIPVTVKKLCQTTSFDAVICLGAVIRGDTPHFDYVCQCAIGGISALARELLTPILNGIITANHRDQALDRSQNAKNSPHGNLGKHAAQAAIEMIYLFRKIDQEEIR